MIDLTADILFDSSAQVVPAGADRIAEVVGKLPAAAALAVGGHTDAVGDDASNTALSQQRAEAVAAIMRTARPDLVLTDIGCGESQPIAPNATGGADDPAGRALNRRVELRVG